MTDFTLNDQPLRIALRQTIYGLAHMIPSDDDGSDETSNSNLRWMCDTLMVNIDGYPTDKTSRWIGFIQGVLATKGFLDVSEERDRTRPFFHEAYKAMSMIIPETRSMGDS